MTAADGARASKHKPYISPEHPYGVCFCGKDLPSDWVNLMWCNDCIDEFTAVPARQRDMTAFIARKKAERAAAGSEGRHE